MSEDRTHPVVFPIEAPAAELEIDLVVKGPFPAKAELPREFRGAIQRHTGTVISATAVDSPAACWAKCSLRSVTVHCEPAPKHRPPHKIVVRLQGLAVTSPPRWQVHSKQQYETNRRTFSRHLPPNPQSHEPSTD